ncbi:hypothetical protein PV326_008883 [Microctonus aethiopoides]|uniref:Hermansky-Pudlak syndrome 3 protein n=1 Tax=Microctonus aethiopoides TaxID=144406 RepID=A0AA39FWX5_9HYME|nr:hypothetical protein PV326_008883 [Microctonus aethiopoides]KAK0177362.1 hypothetical protein PV328_001424 [Microctonus aethiopoides]
MVRIIPVHNFVSQNVGPIEESTASCTANIKDQDLLLLALSSHCVKVYSLVTSQSILLTTFPTVDLVHQLLHCDKGNYVATLESKLSRDGKTTNKFVRIYINWISSGNQNQPMRARIAGRVTPSLNRSQNSLEMIELPLNEQPINIACCQTTGNLLVIMGQEGVIHELKVETQQTTKHKFLDFEIRPWSLKFSFAPSHVGLAEDFIYIMNSTNFILIRLTNQFHDEINSIDVVDSVEIINNTKNRRRSNQNNSNIDLIIDNKNTAQKQQLRKTSIDFTKSINNERTYIDWDELVINETEEIQRLKSLNLIDPETQSVSLSLPSIKEFNRTHKHQFPDLPIVNAPEINIKIATTRSNENGWSENYTVEHLLRLKISEREQSDSQDINREFFTHVVMKPSYKRQKLDPSNFKASLLRSKIYNVFNGVTCLISTTQEGYLYNFLSSSTQEISSDFNYCQIYPFTATVSHLALENCALHALTDAGLESYTLRIPNCGVKTSVNDSDSIEELNEHDPISLIGLRPFLGVKKMLQATRCLVLLASDEDSWTFYSLTLPRPEDIYHDILEAANNHKISSPATYKHLLYEAHIVLRLAKDIIFYSSNATFSDNINDVLISHLDNLYRQSCALLGDYYILSESTMDWHYSTHYYNLAGLKAHVVLSRKNINSAPGLVTFLSESLLNIQAGPEADALFQEHNIVEMLMNAEKDNLLKLILASPILREYATDKLINILLNWQFNDMTRLALVLLYTQADRQSHAEKVLEPIANHFIMEKLLNNWSWLFEVTSLQNDIATPTFSDFAGTLMKQKRRAFSQILTRVVEYEAVSLDKIIQIFLAYLPSRVGRDGLIAASALQLFLETYLQNFYNNEDNTENFAIVEGLKILVRSYLAELARNNSGKIDQVYINNENTTCILFEDLRPKFLDHPLLYMKDEQKEVAGNAEGIDVDDKNQKLNKNIRLEIRKLQALLVSGHLPSECFQEVEHFLNTQHIEGSLSFRILCTKTTEEGIELLANHCPQVLLQFAKNKYTSETEWKLFVDFLIKKITECQSNQESYAIYDELLKDSAIYIAQTWSMRGLHRILSNENLPTFQQYIDISSQVLHADYIKSMIVGTGQHLLCNINF